MIPKEVRDALNLSEGSKLTMEVRGSEIVLSKEAPLEEIKGVGGNLMTRFADFKNVERDLEGSCSFLGDPGMDEWPAARYRRRPYADAFAAALAQKYRCPLVTGGRRSARFKIWNWGNRSPYVVVNRKSLGCWVPE